MPHFTRPDLAIEIAERAGVPLKIAANIDNDTLLAIAAGRDDTRPIAALYGA